MSMIKQSVRVGCLAFAAFLIAATALAGINDSIEIEAGAQSEGRSTVNGRIEVGSGAVINGSIETVNGSIQVDDDVQLESASTVNGKILIGSGFSANRVESVNGSIHIGESARLSGPLETVNGGIRLGAGGQVASDVQNVNGEIELEGSDVGGDLTTVSGDVFLGEGSVLRGDLIIEKPKDRGLRWRHRKPRIVIGTNSQVLGEIRAEQEIELFMSDSAIIGSVVGKASKADVQTFAGKRP